MRAASLLASLALASIHLVAVLAFHAPATPASVPAPPPLYAHDRFVPSNPNFCCGWKEEKQGPIPFDGPCSRATGGNSSAFRTSSVRIMLMPGNGSWTASACTATSASLLAWSASWGGPAPHPHALGTVDGWCRSMPVALPTSQGGAEVSNSEASFPTAISTVFKLDDGKWTPDFDQHSCLLRRPTRPTRLPNNCTQCVSVLVCVHVPVGAPNDSNIRFVASVPKTSGTVGCLRSTVAACAFSTPLHMWPGHNCTFDTTIAVGCGIAPLLAHGARMTTQATPTSARNNFENLAAMSGSRACGVSAIRTGFPVTLCGTLHATFPSGGATPCARHDNYWSHHAPVITVASSHSTPTCTQWILLVAISFNWDGANGCWHPVPYPTASSAASSKLSKSVLLCTPVRAGLPTTDPVDLSVPKTYQSPIALISTTDIMITFTAARPPFSVAHPCVIFVAASKAFGAYVGSALTPLQAKQAKCGSVSQWQLVITGRDGLMGSMVSPSPSFICLDCTAQAWFLCASALLSSYWLIWRYVPVRSSCSVPGGTLSLRHVRIPMGSLRIVLLVCVGFASVFKPIGAFSTSGTPSITRTRSITPSVTPTGTISITPFPVGQWSAVVSSSVASHTCAIKATGAGSGDLYCWGENGYGQLGLGYTNTTGCSCVPSIPSSPALTGVTEVAVGAEHTCAILADDSMACWGANGSGQLGLGYVNTTGCFCELSASVVPTLSGVIAISAGYAHTCAVTTVGSLYCWGDNTYGQLGNGGTSKASSPTLAIISSLVAVGCGWRHSCALTASGGVYCWGDGSYGQLGNGDTSILHAPPGTPSFTDAIAIAAGFNFSCALSSWGDVYCWGENLYGELGLGYNNNTGGCSCVPTVPSSPVMTGVAQLSAGGYHLCALQAGSVYCWGQNIRGQLGNGLASSGASVLSPPGSPALTGVAYVTTGKSHTCALTTGGAISCWGINTLGQLGTGSTVEVDAPGSLSASPTLSVSSSTSYSSSKSLSATQSDSRTSSYSATGSVHPSPSPSPTSTMTFSLSGSTSISISFSGSITATATITSSPTASTSPSKSGAASASPSVTDTGSMTPSVTLTSSVTPTTSVTPTATSTATATATASISASITTSASPSLSSTQSTTSSVTFTPTASVTVSVSPSYSSSPSDTISPSGSTSSTATATSSGSGSATTSVTMTGSASITPTLSATGSVSASVTPTVSVSCSGSQTGSSTPSAGASSTSTVTVTATASQSLSFTTTATASSSPTSTPSGSGTGSVSFSITSSASGSLSASSSGSVSVTVTASVSASGSVTVSGSVSPSGTQTVTGSSSSSVSASRSWSITASSTPTVSGSSSATATGTASLTPSVSTTGSVSVSVTPTASSSASKSSTETVSLTVSPSCSGTVSATASQSSIATVSTSPTATPSASGTGSSIASVSSSLSSTATTTLSSTASSSTSSTSTPTTTVSSSGTGSTTASVSSTTTASMSIGASPSVTASLTLSASVTPSVTVTPTLTPSVSSTVTLTQSGSGSSTPSNTFIATVSATSTTTPSQSPSGTGSASTTTTSSPSVSATITLGASGSATPSSSTTATLSATVTATVSEATTGTSSGTAAVTTSSSATITVTGSASVTTTATATGTASNSGTATLSTTTSAISSHTSSGTGSTSASASSSPSTTATRTITATLSSTVTATGSVTSSVSSSPTSTVTATRPATPSATPSPCPAGCSACVSTNCTACFPGTQWQLGYRADEVRYTCVLAVAVPSSFACSVAEESPAGAGVTCPPLPTGVALSLSPLTLSGGGHPFIIFTALNGSVSLVVGPSVGSLPLDYGVMRRYNITLAVCVPQVTGAFSGPGVTAAYTVCEAAQHMDMSATLTIDLSPINKPPVFTLPSLSLSTPGVASAGDTIGFPLSLYAVNPNTVAPWNTLYFSIVGGRCGVPANQSSIPTPPGLPFTVSPANGLMMYTTAVTTSTAWANPLYACATTTNGGGLNASITITVTFTAVAAQLSVFPTAVAVTHYALGVSSSSATVSLYVGTLVGLTWDVANVASVPWLLGVRASDTDLALSVNSSKLGPDCQLTPVSVANITLTTSDGLLTALVSVTLRLSIPAAALSPTSLSQLVRQGSIADTSISIASIGTGTLAFRVIVAAPWASVTQESSTGTIAPGESVSVLLRANAASMAPSLYPTTITIQTNAPGGVAADPTAPASFATGSVLSLPWGLRVVQALLFPTDVNVTVRPGSRAVATAFSIVNFAGSPILALLPQGAASSVSASAPLLAVGEDQLGAFNLLVAYPSDPKGAFAFAMPGQYMINITVSCWKQVADSDTVNVTAGSLVSPLARSDIFYVPITLPQITVNVTAVPGTPNATLSSVILTTSNATLVHVPVVLWVSVRDAGNFSVPFDSAFDAVSLTFNTSESAVPVQLVSAMQINLNDTNNSTVVEYTLQPVSLGLVTIHVTVGGVAVPGGVVALTVTGPVCTGDLVLDIISITCVCASGSYSNVDTESCVPCPAGTYNPSPGNGSLAQCLSCPAGWYCERGSVAATASCPSGNGFDCSDGTLRTREGYWTSIPTNPSGNASWTFYSCGNPSACPSGRVEAGPPHCAAGYVGLGCSSCAPGYVAVGTFCLRCHYPWLLFVGVCALPVLTVLVVALLVVLLLEEKRGVKQVRAMWIPAQSGTLISELRILFDFVQVVALQSLVRAREYQWFMAGVLSLTGGGLGGGLGIETWQPFLCVFYSSVSHQPRVVFWAQLSTVLMAFPLAAAAASVSVLLTRVVWQVEQLADINVGRSSHSWWRRFGVALLLTQWAVMMSVVRAAVTYPEGGDGNNIAVSILAVYGAGTVAVILCTLYNGTRFGAIHGLVKLVAVGYKSDKNKSLFDVLLLARKCGLICIAALVKDPFLGSLLSLVTSVVVWMVAVIWKPTAKQMQLRLLQAVILSLHVLMLLQASGHAQPTTMVVWHALWLALLCVVLIAASYSLGVATYKLLHPPVSLVQNHEQPKARDTRANKVGVLKAFRNPQTSASASVPSRRPSMLSRSHRVGRAGGVLPPKQGSESKPLAGLS